MMEVVAIQMLRMRSVLRALVHIIEFVSLYFPDSSDPGSKWDFYGRFFS